MVKRMKNKIEYILKHNVIANKIFKCFMSIFFRIIGFLIPIDNKMILFSGLSKKYNDSPKAIYEQLISDKKYNDYKMVWAIEDNSEKIPGNPIVIKPDTFKYFIYCLKSKYWIAAVNIERGLNFKKKKCIYLNTWHGCPLKTIGNSAVGRKDYNFNKINYFCSSGEYEDNIYIKDFNINRNAIIHSGLPRNDCLYHVTKNEIDKIRLKLKLPMDKKIILYAPTWRDSTDGGKTYGINLPVNFKKWEEILSKEYIVLLRTHPNTNKLMKLEFNEFVRDYSNYKDINDLLKISDILISDYSATIFDFSILERPIISFAYDYELYCKERGLYIDLKKEIPGGIESSEDDVIKRISNMNWESERKKVSLFKDKYLEYGGSATKQCIEQLFEEK